MRFCTFYSRLSFFLLCFGLWQCHSKQGQFYQIGQGDTAFRIAHQHDLSVNDIQAANPQKNLNRLRAGQNLWIPSTLKRSRAKQEAIRKALPSKPASKKTSKGIGKPIKQVSTPSSASKVKLYWPYKGKVVGAFGMHNQKMHNGIDIQIPVSKPIVASQHGSIAYVGKGIDGYGLTVIVQHENYVFTVYAYLGSTKLSKGQKVQRGQVIGMPKKEGGKDAFFHFEIRKVKTALDPLQLLRD